MWGVKEMSRSKRWAQQPDGGTETGEAGEGVQTCSCAWPLSDQSKPRSDLVIGMSFAEAIWEWVVEIPRRLLFF